LSPWLSELHPAGDTSRANPRFDREFLVDTDLDRIDETYMHYRPPLEATVTVTGTGETFELIVAHAKRLSG
jgi:hypothetical protein